MTLQRRIIRRHWLAREDFKMATRRRRQPLPQDLVDNDTEVGDFLALFGRKPSPPTAVKPKPVARRRKPAGAIRLARSLAERRWLREMDAEQERTRQAEAAGEDGTPARLRSPTWWQDLP
jgi:hypothetical protein